MYFQSKLLRAVLLGGYRAATRTVFFLPGPAIFVNSMPKAGTHLLTAMLTCLPRVIASGRHIERWRVNRLARGRVDLMKQEFDLDDRALSRIFRTAHNGQIISAHLTWDDRIGPLIDAHRLAAFHMIRDPRDILVSAVKYVTHLERHPLHRLYVERFPDEDSRLMAQIEGIRDEDGRVVRWGFDQRAALYRGWLNQPNVRVVRFEHLVGARGGGDPDVQRREIQAITRHVRRELTEAQTDALIERLATRRGATFRKGRIGGWKEHFTERHKEAFKRVAGDELVLLGYETDDNW